MTTPATRLARHREGDPANARARIDDDGLGLSIELPSATALASFALGSIGVDLVATSRGIAPRSTPAATIPAADLVSALRDLVTQLPEVSGARRPYVDLRRFGATRRPVTDSLLASAVRELARSLPKYTPPRRDAAVGPQLSAAEAARQRRERIRAHQRAAACEWLSSWQESAVPGAVRAGDLYAQACAAIEDYVAADVDLDDGRPYVMPGRDNFYAIADELLSPRVRRNGHRVYRIAA